MVRGYVTTRASLDVAVRAGSEQTTPRGLGVAVSVFGGPCDEGDVIHANKNTAVEA